MFPLVLLCSSLLASPPADSTPPADDLGAYQAAAAHVGRSADAHVKLALWCEAHGLQAERLKHLAIAVLTDPTNATARGLMGLVTYRGKWQAPDVVADKVKADEALTAALAEYNARRDNTPAKADAQWKLALWCEEKGLKAEAMAHLATVVRLDPSREAAWKKMGYKRHDGRMMTNDQIAAEKAETDRQHLANRVWKPKLEKWRGWLAEKSPRHSLAEKALADVTDPRAVPAVWVVLANGESDQQSVAVQLFGQIDSPSASQALVYLATLSNSPEVRRRAAETLSRRDPRDVVDLLIGFFRDPVKYEVKPSNGPGSSGVLLVEGKKFNVRRNYTLPPLPANVLNQLNDPSRPFRVQNAMMTASGEMEGTFGAGFMPFARQLAANPAGAAAAFAGVRGKPGGASSAFGGSPGGVANIDPVTARELRQEMVLERNLAEAQKAAAAVQQQMFDDINEIETFNQNAQATNGYVETILRNLTGQDLGQNSESWQRWWTDQQGYAYQETPQSAYKPTVDQQVAIAYTPQYIVPHHACFAAGTLVRTRDGSRPIETIRAGDVVLSQDTRTGELGYRPVLKAFHNPPAATLRIDLGSEVIVVTGIHRFWKPGIGWTMARELKPGDAVRTLGGVAKVASVETATAQPVFNLEVAVGRSFFVGTAGALVHDNSLVQPELQPFDAPPVLAAVSARTGK